MMLFKKNVFVTGNGNLSKFVTQTQFHLWPATPKPLTHGQASRLFHVFVSFHSELFNRDHISHDPTS